MICRTRLAMVVILALVPAVASAQSLVLDIEAAARSLPGKPLQVSVELRNGAQQAVALPAEPGWDPAGRMTLSISRDGAAAQPLPAESVARPDLPEAERGATLAPGHAVGLFRVVPGDMLATPGEYSLQVRYDGPAGSVVSPVVRVVVGE